MSELLPLGAYVRVTEPSFTRADAETDRSYVAKVVGYDLGRSKYQLGARYGGWGGWLFAAGGSWAFPSWCEKISEAEALR